MIRMLADEQNAECLCKWFDYAEQEEKAENDNAHKSAKFQSFNLRRSHVSLWFGPNEGAQLFRASDKSATRGSQVVRNDAIVPACGRITPASWLHRADIVVTPIRVEIRSEEDAQDDHTL